MRTKPSTSLVTSPILVGAVTVLVTLVTVFLAYNANEGLPFVPTYDVDALVPNAAGLAKDNEVRIGGKRVGVLKRITAQPGPRRPLAVLHMSLDKRIVLRVEDKCRRAYVLYDAKRACALVVVADILEAAVRHCVTRVEITHGVYSAQALRVVNVREELSFAAHAVAHTSHEAPFVVPILAPLDCIRARA